MQKPKIRTVEAARAYRAAQEAEKAALANARAVLNDENTALKAKVSEGSEKMKTIAGLFSTTVWNLLPQKIKQYFTEYRS